MADLPTPSVSGQFNAANTSVSGTVTWDSQTNLEDLAQVRVRYVRQATSATKRTPNADAVSGRAENTGGWATFTDGGSSYQYRDDVITGGFDNTPTSYTDRSVNFSEASLSGYYCWGIARLEV